MIQARLARRVLGVLLLLAVINSVYALGQQPNTYSSPTIGSTPLGLAPGAPLGSYALSGFDNVNLFNGGLNFRLPLLNIGGRGSAGYTMMLKIEQKWRVESATFLPPPPGGGGEQPPEIVNHIPVGYWWAGLEPGYGPGVLQGRHSGDGSETCSSASPTQRFFSQTLTRLTFTAPDGTEYDLRDELTGGTPHNLATGEWCNSQTFSRGRVWITDDGSAATFISDTVIRDQYADPTIYPGDLIPPDSTGALFYPSGLLFMKDGTRYRIDNGTVTWMADRNGNQINFIFTGGALITSVIDSLNRKVDIVYADFNATPPITYDEIKYKGFDQVAHGANRSIKIHYASLGSVLRSGFILQSTQELFGTALDGSDQDFDPTVVSAVELPDGRQYQFRYNSFGELARVVLPTGGATEYDYDEGIGPNHNSGVIVSPRFEIYRRVVERRVYPNGGSGGSFESKTTYSRPENYVSGVPVNDGFVVTQQLNNAGNALATERHLFHGAASPTLMRQPNDYAGFADGKEHQTRLFNPSGTTQLRQINHTWVNGDPEDWPALQPGPSSAPRNPRIIETFTTLKDVSPNLEAKQTFAYDLYNNVTDTCEYDFGPGAAGSLLRHTRTGYLTVHPVSMIDYANSTFDLVEPRNNIHQRNLPLFQIVNTACGSSTNPVSRTDYEYDNYTPDPQMNHAALVPRSDISLHYSFFDSSYLTRGNVTAVMRWLNNPSGTITNYQQYDIAGNVTKAIDPMGRATTVSYNDDFGGPNGSVDDVFSPPELNPQEPKKTYAFPTSVTNALAQISYSQFNYYIGQTVDSKDINNTVSSAFYQDLLDRPTELWRNVVAEVAYSRTRFLYDDANRKITRQSDQVTVGDFAHQSMVKYDGLGRTTRTAMFEGNTGSGNTWAITDTEFDPLSRVSKVSNPFRASDPNSATTPAGTSTITGYDGLGRVVTVTTPDNAVVNTDYSGNKVMVTDQATKRRISETNAVGQLTRVWEVLLAPDGASVSVTFDAQNYNAYLTSYSYDALDDLTGVTQGTQPQRSFVYDSLKRLKQANNPENGAINYTYHADSSLFTKQDARGTTTYFYDTLARLIKRTYTDTQTPQVDYFYDNQPLPSGSPSFSRGASIGRLVAVTYGGLGSTTGSYQGYDALGRTTISLQKTDSQVYPIGYSFNLADEMTSQTYPSGRQVVTEYDTAGRAAGVRSGASYYAGAAPMDLANRIQYTPHGAVSLIKLGNGKWERTLFNVRLQTTQIDLGSSSGASDLLKLEYTYGSTTNNGNVMTQKITAPLISSGSLVLTQTYIYDDLNRLKTASENGTSWSQNYDYDRWGNRAVNPSSLLIPNPTQTPQSLSAFDTTTNRIKPSVMPGIHYDAAGNLDSQPNSIPSTDTMVYDAENKQTRHIKGGVTTDYAYDGDGRRVKRVAGGITTIFVYNVAGQLIAEYDNSTGPPPGGGTSYLTTDHLGSTGVVTSAADGQGVVTVKTRYDYLPFGEEIGSNIGGRSNVTGYGAANSTRQKFTQKERDNESGLDYFLARYYSSAQGRFTSPDEFNGGPHEVRVLGSGDPEKQALSFADTTDPRSLNKYAYCLNNPFRYTDPDGHQQLPTELVTKLLLRYNEWKEGAKRYARAIAGSQDHDEVRPTSKFGPLDVNGDDLAREHFSMLGKGSEVVAEVISYLDPVGIADIVRNHMKGDRDGVIYAAAGSLLNKVGVKGIAKHGIDRIIERGVKPDQILDALKNPLKTGEVVIDELGRPAQRIVGKKAEVVINPETSVIVSANPTSKRKAKRLARQLENH